MSDDNTLTGELEQTATVTEETTDYLDSLVGDNKKYKTPQDLAKAYINADLHIKELRETIDEVKGNETVMNEILTELRNKPTQNVETTQEKPKPSVDRSDNVDIEKLVSDEVSKLQNKEKSETTRARSLELLTAYYGDRDKALEAIRTKINGNPTIKEVINRLGDNSPEETFRYITGENPGTDNMSATGQSNTPGLENRPSAHTLIKSESGLTWTQCRELRKKNLKEYNSPAFRAKIEAAATAYTSRGEDFYAT